MTDAVVRVIRSQLSGSVTTPTTDGKGLPKSAATPAAVVVERIKPLTVGLFTEIDPY